MGDNSFVLGGRKFQTRKIDVFKQFHVARRMGPTLAKLFPLLKGAVSGDQFDKLSETEKFDVLAKFATPVMEGLSSLSDADADLVLYGLLSSVEMQQPAGNWAQVASGNMLMIQDLDLPTMLQLAGRAFIFNLSGFFSVSPPRS